ncbi:hypothetical protein NQ318_008230, partial [Aromia moschata]
AYAMLKEVYRNECLSRTQVLEWFKRFKERNETTKDDPRPERPSMSKMDENVNKIVRGIVFVNWIPEGQTINQHYYIEVLTALRERVRRRRPDLWKTKPWKIRQDNATAHSALSVKAFFAKYSITVLEHKPCSPNLAPSDFFFISQGQIGAEGDKIRKCGSG